MSMAQLALTISEYVWLGALAPSIWVVLRTRTARTAARIVRVSAWDWLLHVKGVPGTKRRELILDAARRDLGFRDPP